VNGDFVTTVSMLILFGLLESLAVANCVQCCVMFRHTALMWKNHCVRHVSTSAVVLERFNKRQHMCYTVLWQHVSALVAGYIQIKIQLVENASTRTCTHPQTRTRTHMHTCTDPRARALEISYQTREEFHNNNQIQQKKTQPSA
jgi:hypothetical protein